MTIWKHLLALLGLDVRSRRVYTLDLELQRSLQRLAEEECRAPDDVAATLISAALHERRHVEEAWAHWHTLSPREQEVAALICLNFTSRQIAARLNISPETVKSHARNLLHKFGVNNRQELRVLLSSWDFSAWL